MSMSGQFKSVLDDRSARNISQVYSDRITRHRSPSRHRDDREEIIPRIPQPYRTSLSAVAPPIRVKKSDRGRSISPAVSQSSRNRSKSPGIKRTSPKHVTYDERVTVRHSDTEESILTDLSGRDSADNSPCFPDKIFARDSFDDTSSGPISPAQPSQEEPFTPDYSAQIRKVSRDVVEHYPTTATMTHDQRPPTPQEQYPAPPRQHKSSGSKPRFSKSSRSSVQTPNGRTGASHPAPSSSPGKGDSGVYTDGDISGMTTSKHGSKPLIQRDYIYDRTVSYRLAIQAQYSEEVRRLAEKNIHELLPSRRGTAGSPMSLSPLPRTERSNTMPTQTMTDADNLSGSKKSVSSSIGNFFRKISPSLGRRRKTGRGSAQGSAASLEGSDYDGSVSSMDFSRGDKHGRSSFMQMMGRVRSRSRSKSNDNERLAQQKSHENEKPRSHRDSESSQTGSIDHTGKHSVPDSANRILKSIEQNSSVDKTVYHKFKQKQSPNRAGEKSLSTKPQAVKVSPDIAVTRRVSEPQQVSDSRRVSEPRRVSDSRRVSEPRHGLGDSHVDKENRGYESHQSFNDSSIGASSTPAYPDHTYRGAGTSPAHPDPAHVPSFRGDGSPKIDPPKSLNVRPVVRPLYKNMLQASTVSAGSEDESIGDCSLNVNIEETEPGLSSSKHIAVSEENLIDISESSLSSYPHQQPLHHHGGVATQHRLGYHQGNSPIETDLDDLDYSGINVPSIYVENGVLIDCDMMPVITDSGIVSHDHIPSYLKLSRAVSGYSRYSSYSSYKDLDHSGCSSNSSRRDNSDIGHSSRTDNSASSASLRQYSSHSGDSSSVPPRTHIVHAAGDTGDVRGSCVNGHCGATDIDEVMTRLELRTTPIQKYPTGNPETDGNYFLEISDLEEERLQSLCAFAEHDLVSQPLTEEISGKIRAAVGKTQLLITKKFKQFRGLCERHKNGAVDPPTLWEDLQGFWDIVKLPIENIDEQFQEIALLRQNDWKELSYTQQSSWSNGSNSSKSLSLSRSSTGSASLNNNHTPGHTPVSKRKPVKDGVDGSKSKARDQARKKLLAEKRAAMKQQREQDNVEIFVPQ